MVGVVGSSPIAPTRSGRNRKHSVATPSAFLLAGGSLRGRGQNAHHPARLVRHTARVPAFAGVLASVASCHQRSLPVAVAALFVIARPTSWFFPLSAACPASAGSVRCWPCSAGSLTGCWPRAHVGHRPTGKSSMCGSVERRNDRRMQSDGAQLGNRYALRPDSLLT